MDNETSDDIARRIDALCPENQRLMLHYLLGRQECSTLGSVADDWRITVEWAESLPDGGQ